MAFFDIFSKKKSRDHQPQHPPGGVNGATVGGHLPSTAHPAPHNLRHGRRTQLEHVPGEEEISMEIDLSPFQRSKYEYLFWQFYDSNRNGLITHSDFKDLLKILHKLRRWSLADPRLSQCEQVLSRAWQALKTDADLDKDNKISMVEWQRYWSSFIKKSEAAADGWPVDSTWIKDYMNFWFDLMDTSGDNEIDEDEYTQVCTHFGVAEQSARAAFRHISSVKPVTRDYYAELWLQYMTSDDPAEPGNSVFGRVWA